VEVEVQQKEIPMSIKHTLLLLDEDLQNIMPVVPMDTPQRPITISATLAILMVMGPSRWERVLYRIVNAGALILFGQVLHCEQAAVHEMGSVRPDIRDKYAPPLACVVHAAKGAGLIP
jgi:hypothetical protein